MYLTNIALSDRVLSLNISLFPLLRDFSLDFSSTNIKITYISLIEFIKIYFLEYALLRYNLKTNPLISQENSVKLEVIYFISEDFINSIKLCLIGGYFPGSTA